ncbi:MAG: L,D-transpeptidase family protein [Fibrobacterota bacterium]|nr:L,D-transpeptidase family protein [Fibrobacterota bacterium]QQS07036.1 MAG: L,D-transpeptidase family protein [Fibrobacterota bacterium]
MMRRSFRRSLFFSGLCCVSWVLASDQNRVAVASDSPESLLVRTLDAIRAERLDLALERSDSLVTRQPNFRLAQLVRGDILLAQNGRLDKFAGPRSKDPKAQAMQDEARVRLGRYVQTPPKNMIPRFLLLPPQDVTTVLVVDARASRMFVFRQKDGNWTLEGDHYVSIGLNGPLKSSEGDQRTPLGVYSMVSRIDKAQLDSYYGNVAYPLDYPNDWDKRKGRKGHGIWVHGTPRDTYSRPPRASNGCVVLPNDDIDTLQKWFQLGRTPVILADTIEWVDPTKVDSTRKVLAGAIQKWRDDWSSNDMDRYLSHYSDDFRMGEQDLEAWEREKRRVAAGKSWVKVTTSAMSILLVPGEKDLAVVEFEQDYQSSNLSNLMRKRQYWRFEDGAWKIVHEGAIGKAG